MNSFLLSQNLKVYIGTPLKDVPFIFLIKNQILGGTDMSKNLWNLFQGTDKNHNFDFIRIVDDPKEANYLLIPHDYFTIKNKLKNKEEYISKFILFAKKYNKKIIVFAMADSDEDIKIENSIIFRHSQYAYKKKENEILIPFYSSPVYSEFFMPEREKIWEKITLREKSNKPTVSFCGWAGFPNVYRRITYETRILLTDCKKILLRDRHIELHKRGIFFRRKAIKFLKGSKNIHTNFIIRKSYSAQKGMDGLQEIKQEQAEKEYIYSIINSDFVLSPKGNGNGSIRFYEALSLGRLPILINTDCVLPLSNLINYRDFAIIVNHTQIDKIENYILEFYNSIDNVEFQRRQCLSREAFEMLRPASLLKKVFFTKGIL